MRTKTLMIIVIILLSATSMLLFWQLRSTSPTAVTGASDKELAELRAQVIKLRARLSSTTSCQSTDSHSRVNTHPKKLEQATKTTDTLSDNLPAFANDTEALAWAREQTSSPSTFFRMHAVQILLQQRPEEALDAARDAIFQDADNAEAVAIAAYTLFELNQGPHAVPASTLREFYEGHPSDHLQLISAQLLAQRNDLSLLDSYREQASQDLQDSEASARIHSLQKLGNTQHASAATQITPLLQDEDPAVRLHALLALDKSGNGSHLDAATPLLEDPAPEVRDMANAVVQRLRNLSRDARGQISNSDIAAKLISPGYVNENKHLYLRELQQ